MQRSLFICFTSLLTWFTSATCQQSHEVCQKRHERDMIMSKETRNVTKETWNMSKETWSMSKETPKRHVSFVPLLTYSMSLLKFWGLFGHVSRLFWHGSRLESLGAKETYRYVSFRGSKNPIGAAREDTWTKIVHGLFCTHQRDIYIRHTHIHTQTLTLSWTHIFFVYSPSRCTWSLLYTPKRHIYTCLFQGQRTL